MQSINNLSPRGQQILIIGITLCIMIPLGFFLYNITGSSDPSKRGTYYDKASGETVTNNQAPETFGTDGTNQTYLGVSKLVDLGVTQYQIKALKQALKDYGATRSPQGREYSIATETVKVAPRDPDNQTDIDTITFDLKVDRKDTYKATLEYSNLSEAKLIVKTKDGQTVYASTLIDGSTLTTE